MPILKLAGVLVPTYEAALKQHLMHGRIYISLTACTLYPIEIGPGG